MRKLIGLFLLRCFVFVSLGALFEGAGERSEPEGVTASPQGASCGGCLSSSPRHLRLRLLFPKNLLLCKIFFGSPIL